jgi:hypothetical protein
MAGERDWNLRQGDIAEQLGILILQGLAAVAPVPRTEDVGVDVIATLWRREGARRLIAEDAFYVQLKAASVKRIEYNKEEVEWLRSLDLPFFVGSVDVKESELRLYAAHEFYRLFADWDVLGNFTTLRVFLKDGSPKGHDEPTERRLHLGPPILQLKLADIYEPVSQKNAYWVLKDHIACMQANILSMDAGFNLGVEWQTGKKLIAKQPSQSAGGEPTVLYKTLNKAWRYLHGWYFQMRAFGLHKQADELYVLLLEMEKVGWRFPDSDTLMHAYQQIDKIKHVFNSAPDATTDGAQEPA